LGFLPKWIIIQNSIIFNNKLTIIVIVITTIVTLYFYLRVAYRGFSLQNQLIYWINENVNKSIVFISTAISLISIPIISIINLY
jgi:NADH-ubiquinone oxidoreductase chain 2